VEDFLHPTGDDLYLQMAQNVLGETILKGDPRRNTLKTVFIAQLNGQSPTGLSKELKCTVAEAKAHVEQFFTYYQDVLTFLWLLRWGVAITGATETWAGRIRKITAHSWMVEEPRVRVLLTYANGDKLWYDVSPIKPSLRTLTCFVHRIWSVRDADKPKLIYSYGRGRIGTKWYKSVDNPTLLYFLPIRNLPWRSIRQVQRLDANWKPVEQGGYEGFDATCRYAISSVMQGGSSDLHASMLLHSGPVFKEFGARLLLSVHDEILCECPIDRQEAFMTAWKETLETSPPGFLVPVRVDVASGPRYADCK
jgi:DNA polymerase I-like protein with 3'-5' exonuclease and polymerase domains